MQGRLIFVCLLSLCAGASHAGGEVNGKAPSSTPREWTNHLKTHPLSKLSARISKANATLMDIASDPRILAAAMLVGANPQTYMSNLQRLPDPESLRNGLKLLPPQSAMDWAYSAMDPEFERALLSRATDPQMAGSWMESMRDPAYFQSAVAVFSAPMQWMKVDADGPPARPPVIGLDPKCNSAWMRVVAQSLPRVAKSAHHAAKGKPWALLKPVQHIRASIYL
jgi:hypothetical protein